MTARSPIRGAGRLPGVSLLVVALVLLLHAIPRAAPLLAYERGALARGEPWRWITCHWVHASGELLFWDLVAFVPLAALCELRDRRRLVAALAAATVAIPAALFLLQPQLDFYGGLSGIDSALFALLATLLWRHLRAAGHPARAFMVLAACVAFAAKTGYEAATGSGVFVNTLATNLASSPLAHVAGAAVGITIGAVAAGKGTRIVERRREDHPRRGMAAQPRQPSFPAWAVGSVEPLISLLRRVPCVPKGLRAQARSEGDAG